MTRCSRFLQFDYTSSEIILNSIPSCAGLLPHINWDNTVRAVFIYTTEFICYTTGPFKFN